MANAQVAKQQDQKQAAVQGGANPAVDANASIKQDLRGKPYDEQARMLAPEQAPPASEAGPKKPANTPEEQAEQDKSEADKLRESIAGKAKEWNGKEFMSEAEIEAIRQGTPDKPGMKNYTTCIDFAGKMMREGTKEMYGKDWKKANATAMMLGKIKGDWEQGVGARIQAASFQKSVDVFNKSITEFEAKKTKVAADIESLMRPADEGESELSVKQRHARAKGLQQQLKAFESVIRQQTAMRDKFQAKVDKSQEKSKDIDSKNTAMIKAADGMGNGRPKEGEYIILSQPPGGGAYGVSAETKVHLAGGAFKHIAIFMGVDKEDDGSGVETWRTIDGGGTKGKTTMLFVRKADRMVFPAYQGAKPPEAGSASRSQVAGWIDMDEMIKMRDQKAGGGGAQKAAGGGQ